MCKLLSSCYFGQRHHTFAVLRCGDNRKFVRYHATISNVSGVRTFNTLQSLHFHSPRYYMRRPESVAIPQFFGNACLVVTVPPVNVCKDYLGDIDVSLALTNSSVVLLTECLRQLTSLLAYTCELASGGAIYKSWLCLPTCVHCMHRNVAQQQEHTHPHVRRLH
jgi:hypothetical protein